MKIVNKSNIVSLLVLLMILACGYFIHTSPYFEKEPPKIETPDMSYWNTTSEIPISISDESGIRSYQVYYMNNNEEKLLLKKDSVNEKEVNFNLPIPRINLNAIPKLTYKIVATDKSNYRFFFGNKAEKTFELNIDTKIPKVRIIQMSNIIIKGGSAAVVFYANDEAMSNISVTNGYQSFVAFPFYKKDYYVSIIPWYIHNPTFKGAIIAMDKAGNVRRFNINFTLYNRNYRTSNLALKNNFIDGKIAEIIENTNKKGLEDFSNPIDMFKYVNETIRHNDEEIISEKILNLNKEADSLNVFKPIENARVVGLFGDHRKFSFNKVDAGESYHLGVDLASLKHAPIIANNDGVVVMSEELGIHGNAMIIEHGYGVASLYAHLSEAYKKEGDSVKAGEIIGKSGSTGLAFGDHLHFGILIQGKPSMSNEWMDSKWLKININDVLENAKAVIESDDAKD